MRAVLVNNLFIFLREMYDNTGRLVVTCIIVANCKTNVFKELKNITVSVHITSLQNTWLNSRHSLQSLT